VTALATSASTARYAQVFPIPTGMTIGSCSLYLSRDDGTTWVLLLNGDDGTAAPFNVIADPTTLTLTQENVTLDNADGGATTLTFQATTPTCTANNDPRCVSYFASAEVPYVELSASRPRGARAGPTRRGLLRGRRARHR
jgi:hypothetical protein